MIALNLLVGSVTFSIRFPMKQSRIKKAESGTKNQTLSLEVQGAVQQHINQ